MSYKTINNSKLNSEDLQSMSAGETIIVNIPDLSENIHLSITCFDKDLFTCTHINDTEKNYLTEDIITEQQRVYNYDTKPLSIELLYVSLVGILSAIEKFFEHNGNIDECIQWITEN